MPAYSDPSSPMDSSSPRNSLPTQASPSSPSPLMKAPVFLSPKNVQRNTGSSPSHLSTPPGPPVFSCPLRPASVPFKTSPVTPQSVAPSSDARVNGSLDDSALVGESPLVLFSALKVLKKKKQFNVPSLGFGALVSVGRELSHYPQVTHRDPHRCPTCGSYPNTYCNVLLGSGQWQCVICGDLNGSDGEYAAGSKHKLIHSFPELSSPVVEYVDARASVDRMMSSSPPIVLAVDECLDEPLLCDLQSSLHSFIDGLPPATRIGIVTYGRSVSSYDFSEGGFASADVHPGNRSPEGDAMKSMFYGSGIYLSNNRATANLIVSSMRPHVSPVPTPEAGRERCVGVAVGIAMAILRGPSMSGVGRVIVCAGGPNTYGPGSEPGSEIHYMEELGRRARAANVTVDVLFAGTCPVRASVLLPLVTSSGGALARSDDFGETFGASLRRASVRSIGLRGVLEVRCSDDVSVVRVIGPGDDDVEFRTPSFKRDADLAMRMASVEGGQCFAVYMELKRDVEGDFVFFQFVVRFKGRYGTDVRRVATVRVATVESVPEYLASVQAEVAAVLIAKKAALVAAGDVDMGRRTLDERVKDVAFRFGSSEVSGSGKAFRFPEELGGIPELLFHLRRGPILGGVVGHEDERCVLRAALLNASFDLSIRMVAPRCILHREGGTFEELPAYDLALQSDVAVVLDHGTDVFIWLGAELAAQEGHSAAALAACRTLAEELTVLRFPVPRILAVKEGSSEARYVVCRMIPAHRDAPYEQEARFPQIRMLSVERRAKLKTGLLSFDEPSFCEWIRGLKVVPPSPSS